MKIIINYCDAITSKTIDDFYCTTDKFSCISNGETLEIYPRDVREIRILEPNGITIKTKFDPAKVPLRLIFDMASGGRND